MYFDRACLSSHGFFAMDDTRASLYLCGNMPWKIERLPREEMGSEDKEQQDMISERLDLIVMWLLAIEMSEKMFIELKDSTLA